MTRHVLTFDPGKKTGWSSFLDGRLIAAGVCKREDLFSELGGLVPSGTLVLVEHPRWYPHDHTDVNDLLDLAVLVGEIKRHYEAMGCTVKLVWPRSWKGNVPKDVTNRRTVAALDPVEVALMPRRPRAKDFDHNMLDAIGLGLHELGRLR